MILLAFAGLATMLSRNSGRKEANTCQFSKNLSAGTGDHSVLRGAHAERCPRSGPGSASITKKLKKWGLAGSGTGESKTPLIPTFHSR
jgi:hypothetical protein